MPVPFDKLYPKQKKVIMHRSGPLLVLAGPGTGKTEVLTHRIVVQVKNQGVHPKEILAITFSRRAKREMAERLENFGGFEENEPRISTLHAEAFRILCVILDNKLFLLDNDETRLLVRDAAEDLGLNLKWQEFKKIESMIGLHKANNILPNEISCLDKQTETLKELYERYEELLSFNHAIDLDGLVMRVVRILSSNDYDCNPEIRHISVDEYQDINHAEFKFIQILAKNVASLFVVGDDDQSIYGWRGADPSIIRRFKKNFPDDQVEILKESHRCTGHIGPGSIVIS